MNRIVIIGGGGHARVLVCVLSKLGFSILGYTDQCDGGTMLGVRYLGNDSILRGLRSARGSCSAVIGVGKIDISRTRERLHSEMVALGFEFPAIVSPDAVVNEGTDLGPGTVVFDGAVVNTGTIAGSQCILNTNCTVDHDCRLGINVHIAPGSVLSGGVTIGDHCMIGAGSTLIQGVTVCAGCLVGAGSTVVSDIRLPGTYVGSPARRTA